jgi:hypothetical protein
LCAGTGRKLRNKKVQVKNTPLIKSSLQTKKDPYVGVNCFVKTPGTAVGCGDVKKAKARPLKIEIPLSYPYPSLKIRHSLHPNKIKKTF